ncbi:MAG: fumarylacetoacetate hydrolase family protein [Rhodobacteraceae bacterium]|nr:fumarylacetoacetate hydrolase family protein [Paracoccaceae bacterium]
MSDAHNADLIARIVDDIANHAVFEPYADLIPENVDAAYFIQDRVVEMLEARGVREAPCGYKLALNSQHLMAHFGRTEPCYGRMFSDQKWQSGASLSANDYRGLLIEAEIMAVMATDMPRLDGGHTRATAEAAIERYFPAVELVDTRGLELPKARVPSVVAQNITTEGLVHGGPGLTPDELDVETLPVSLSFDGQVVAKTKGTPPQHPGDAIAWLANQLTARGGMLKAGDIVICGTHVPPPPLGGASHVLLDMGPLGQVEFTVC